MRKDRGLHAKYAADVFREAFLSPSFAVVVCLIDEKKTGMCVDEQRYLYEQAASMASHVNE